jgi:hypothetical protein
MSDPDAARPAGHAPRPAALETSTKAARSRNAEAEALDLQQQVGNTAVSSSLAPSRLDKVTGVLESPGKPLGQDVVDLVKETTGDDASGITLHDGPEAAEAARSVDAKMFASGNHIVAPEGLDVTTEEGVFGTVHEVHHILNQQAKGAVAGTDTGDGLSISDPLDSFEQEADAAGEAAVAQTFS